MPAATLTPEVPALILEPDDRAPSRARRFLADQFRELEITDDYIGRLVVTELVTNAYKHVGFGHIVVRVVPEERGGHVRIEVWDESTARPVPKPEDLGATSGRGLLMMAELVHDWGVRPLNNAQGKIVWARCAS
jgi:anti-sigma regulatory factor (Ser/Thr protein kinase)